ncbi:hypothetical protein [Pseudoduganella sp.]|uniref:hypothetical protein n=1 Tax=Pseudoduganella sp. TaxID=1880898 RepID=UPI0035ADC0D1
MISSEQQNFDFDGVITSANGHEFPASCRLTLPDATWQRTEIHISVAQIAGRQSLPNPLNLSGNDRYGRQVTIRDIHYHSIHFEFNRQTGLAEMEIKHVGEVEVIHAIPISQASRVINISLSDAQYLKSKKGKLVDSKDYTRIEELFSLDLPELGHGTFLRQWRFWHNVDNVTSKGACSFLLELKDLPKGFNIDSAAEQIRSALSIPSVFLRQRLAVNGWEEQGATIREIVRQPFAPILPKNFAMQPYEYLVQESQLENVMQRACVNFSKLAPKLKRTVEKIALGLSPYNHLGDEERFRAMFYGLESCRKLTSKVPSAEVLKARDEVLVALKFAHKELSGAAAERVNGFINSVENGPKVDLRIEIEEVLDNWKVARSDLWPLYGSEAEPGLVKIRDKLSHSGGTSVNNDSLVLATYHLSLLMERIILAILDIPLSETLLSPEALKIDPWYARDRVLSARRAAFTKSVWS